MGYSRSILTIPSEIATLSDNPVLVMWGPGQEMRYDENSTGRSVAVGNAGYTACTWELDDSELWFGATSDMIALYDDDEYEDDITTDFDGTIASGLADNVFFSLEAGWWSFRGFVGIGGANLSHDSFRILRVRSTDDEIIATSTSTTVGNIQEPFRPKYRSTMLLAKTAPMQFAADDYLIIAIGEGEHSALSTAQWLECEYLGTSVD